MGYSLCPTGPMDTLLDTWWGIISCPSISCLLGFHYAIIGGYSLCPYWDTNVFTMPLSDDIHHYNYALIMFIGVIHCTLWGDIHHVFTGPRDISYNALIWGIFTMPLSGDITMPLSGDITMPFLGDIHSALIGGYSLCPYWGIFTLPLLRDIHSALLGGYSLCPYWGIFTIAN